MEQQQVAIDDNRLKMNFSQMSPVSLSDLMDELLDRSKVFIEIVEGNSLDGTTLFETLSPDAIAKLSWQAIENLKIAKELNSVMWERYKLDTGFGQLQR